MSLDRNFDFRPWTLDFGLLSYGKDQQGSKKQ